MDEALCFGWIDGVRRRIDDEACSIRFASRRPTSIWSAVNIVKVEQLQAVERMTAAGAAAFAHRKDHRSAVYAFEQACTAELSPQELAAFQRDAAAWAFFQATPPGYRKQMLHRVATAKKAETRTARFARLRQACAAGQRLR